MIDHELTIGYYSDEFLSLQGPQGIQLLSNEEIWMFSLETNLNSATFHDIPWHLMIALGAYWFLALLIMLEMPPSGILPGTDPPPSDICSGPVIRWMSLKWDVKYLYTIYVTTPISNPKSTWLNWLNVPMLPSRLIPQSHPAHPSTHEELKVAFTNVFTEVPGSPIFLMKMVSKAQMIPKDIDFRRNDCTIYITIYMSSLNLLEMIDSRYSNSY